MAELIDTHHHIVPDFLAKAIEETGGDPSGWPTPDWTPEKMQNTLQVIGIKKSYISFTAPGTKIYQGEQSRELARKLNEYAAGLAKSDPERIGIFGALPNLTDVEGALAEIDYAYNVLKVDGFTFFTSYGDEKTPLYLGHKTFEPIWEKVNQLKTVIFIHPSEAPSNQVNHILAQPTIDYPHETSRAAADIVTSGTRRKFKDVAIILSHAGGTLPILSERIIGGVTMLKCALTPEELIHDFKSFYYDVALSGSPVLFSLLALADHSKIIYGSDFPFAPLEFVVKPQKEILKNFFLNGFGKQFGGEELLEKVFWKNAEALFKAHPNPAKSAI